VSAREFLRLVAIAFAFVGLWLVFGLFNTSEFYRRAIAMRGELPDVIANLQIQIVSSLNWAWMTPIVVAIAERLRLRGSAALRNLSVLAVLTPLLATFRTVAGASIQSYVEDGYVKPEFLELSLGIRSFRNIFIITIIIIVTNLVIAQTEELARERRTILLQTALANSELEDVRSRLRPAFLFATLDAIAARIRSAPAVADRMLVALSYLLRRSLDFGRTDDISLGDELAFVERYLSIQQMRFDGLVANVDVDEDVLGARVPPLFLQPLVDDVVAYSIAERGGSHIVIRGRAEGARLRLELHDDGMPDEQHGAAFRQLETLLTQRFGVHHDVTVDRSHRSTVATIHIPLIVPEAEVHVCAS
jgi:two-component system LytT family sensor kinase